MFDEHPSVDIIGTLGSSLEGKRIILAITGSVAAVEAPALARYLMRHGALVYPVMTKAATELIHPNTLEWATGQKVITELTGAIEHVALAGNIPHPADLLLIAPSTANTIGKMAVGIDDTAVTTFFTTAFGEGLPIVVVPAMHKAMYDHPFVLDNIKKLEDNGVRIVMPRVEEGKAKIPSKEDIFHVVEELLNKNKSLSGKKILISAGRTVEYIDPVRVITNNSSGKMGLALAQAAREMGAQVTLIYGKGSVTPSEDLSVIHVETAEEMYNSVFKELDKSYDIFIAAAAVGDWQAHEVSPEKISTHTNERLVLTLIPTPKIIDKVKASYPGTALVAFRAQSGLTQKELMEDAKSRRKKAKAEFIAVNDVSAPGSGFETDTNQLWLIDSNEEITQLPFGSKKEVARNLLAHIGKKIYNR